MDAPPADRPNDHGPLPVLDQGHDCWAQAFADLERAVAPIRRDVRRRHLPAAVIDGMESPVNADSIVLLVDNLDFQVVLTGDATLNTETAILARYPAAWLDVDMLKIGHHGSSTTSTGADWLAAVRPEIAVVSASPGNSYDHPRQTVIEAVEDTHSTGPHRMRWGWSVCNRAHYADLSAYDGAVYSTANSGTEVVTSGGSGFQVSTER